MISNRSLPSLKEGFILYPYQAKAIEWMQFRENSNQKNNYGINGGLICMKMGLGKTLTALEHSLLLQNRNKEKFPTLIIASKTVMYEWKNQGVNKFYDNIKALYLHKDFIGDEVNNISATDILDYNVVITTFDQCVSACKKTGAHNLVCEYGKEGLLKGKIVGINLRRKPIFNATIKGSNNIYKIPWRRVICDESQKFSNPKTFIFKAMMAIYADYKWCLTGTPVRNYKTDIWSQLRVCGYNAITEPRLWKHTYFKQENLNRYVFESNYESNNIEMPEKIVHVFNVQMDKKQNSTYKALLIETQDLYEKMLSKIISYAAVLAMFTRLRQVCIAPNLIVKTKGEIKKNIDETILKTKLGDWICDDESTAGIDSPKIQKIIEIIEKIPKGEKIILFSMFVNCLHLVEKAIKINFNNINYDLLTGSVSGQKRETIINNFKDNDIDILLVHYKVGGEGLNLIEANHVICIEPWWSPSVHNQAIARCWRRGQLKPVHIYWVLVTNTIEQSILTMCENKEQLSNYYLHDGEYNPKTTGLTKSELHKLLIEK